MGASITEHQLEKLNLIEHITQNDNGLDVIYSSIDELDAY
jgi:hypothetical protein